MKTKSIETDIKDYRTSVKALISILVILIGFLIGLVLIYFFFMIHDWFYGSETSTFTYLKEKTLSFDTWRLGLVALAAILSLVFGLSVCVFVYLISSNDFERGLAIFGFWVYLIFWFMVISDLTSVGGT